jgi:hypothetical protein
MKKSNASLVFCLVMDIVGYATYTIPVLGEFGDIIWAPISAIIFFITFGGWKGAMGGVFNFVEEILPGTDFIPSFTLMWLWQRWRSKESSLQRTGIQRP